MWWIAVLLAVLFSCGGGGGGRSGGAFYPELGIFFHTSERSVPCGDVVYDFELVARCVYRNRATGAVEVLDVPSDYLSYPPTCVEDGYFKVYRYFEVLGDPSSGCLSFSDRDFLGALWIVRESLGFSSSYFGGDTVSLDPITTLASYPYPWWGSDLTSGGEAERRMDILSQYAGFSSYPPILSSLDHESFMSQVKANLGLPPDSVKEVLMDALMEKRLQERWISFGEYFSSLPDTSSPVHGVSFKANEESSFPPVSPVCGTGDTVACPSNDSCIATDNTSFPCFRFHSGKFALKLHYDLYNESFFYCFSALDERTGKYFFVGRCAGLYFEVPSLGPGESVRSYNRLYCEDGGTYPFTVKCYTELTTTLGRTLVVSNYFTFDLAGY